MRARRTVGWTVLPVALLALAACAPKDEGSVTRLAMPVGATDRAPLILHLWQGSWIAALLVGALVWGLIIYAVIKFRRRSDEDVPVQTRYHLPLEILYTVAPIIMIAVLFYFTVRTEDKVLAEPKHPAHTVDVVGQQWSWTFNYVKDKSLDGSTTVHVIGNTAYQPTLVLPLGQSVQVNLSSPDVIHSFWVPAFLMKMDVIPGRHNHFSFTPTRIGTYAGRCAELCGVYHSRMLFNLKIVKPARYAAYLSRLEKQGHTGLALGGENGKSKKAKIIMKVQRGTKNGAGS